MNTDYKQHQKKTTIQNTLYNKYKSQNAKNYIISYTYNIYNK